jgi:hypothetical protein
MQPSKSMILKKLLPAFNCGDMVQLAIKLKPLLKILRRLSIKVEPMLIP